MRRILSSLFLILLAATLVFAQSGGFDFPANPTNGQQVTGPGGQTFEWDGVKWIALGGGGGGGGGFTPGGDLSGSATSQIVVGIQTKPIPVPATGYLHYNGTAFVWDTPSGGGGGPWLPVNNPAFTGNMTGAADSTFVIGDTFLDHANVTTDTVNAGAGIIQTITSQDILLQAANTSVPNILQVGINGGAQYLTITGAGQVLLGSNATAPLGATTLQQVEALIAAGGGGGGAPITSGTWLPDMRFGGSNAGFTYNTQIGGWYAVGKMYHADYQIFLGQLGTATGAVTVCGLPAAGGGPTGSVQGMWPISAQFGFDGLSAPPAFSLGQGSTCLSTLQMGLTGTGGITSTNVPNMFWISGSIDYEGQ